MEQNIKKRNIFICLILSIITCGLYSIYWLYVLLRDTYNLADYDGSPVLDILFTFITCGLYGFYLWYKIAGLHNEINEKHNIKSVNNTILYIALYFFGLSIINYCILQDDINKIANYAESNNSYKQNDINNANINNTTDDNNVKFIIDSEKESFEDTYNSDDEITPEVYNVDNEQGFEQIYGEDEKTLDELYDTENDDEL